MGCFTMNIDGKEEGVEIKAIDKVKVFLKYEDENTVNYTAWILMFLTIDLDAKNQLIHQENDEIIVQLIKIINKSAYIKQNCHEILKNISENQKGF